MIKSVQVDNPPVHAEFFYDISLTWLLGSLMPLIMRSQRSKYKEFVHLSYSSRSRTTNDRSMCPESVELSPYLQNKRGKAYALDHTRTSAKMTQ